MKKLFAAIMLTGSLAFAAVMTGAPPHETREYLAIGIDKVHIENTSGKITVSPMTVNKIEILATKKKFSEKCSYSTEKSDFNEVNVKVERPIGEDCEVDIEVKMPKDADLNIWSGSGSVAVTDIESNFTFNVGSGSVTASGKFKKVDGKSGSGTVDINGLTTGGNISVGNGSVNLRFLEYPTGLMEVKTGNGDAHISFPKGSKINTSLDTGSGDVVNEIGTFDSADFGLRVKTGHGDLKIKAY